MTKKPVVPLLLAFFSLFLLAAAHADSGRGRNKKLYAVPAPPNIQIDGNLDSWDWSGHIFCYDRSETADVQSGEFAVMYDDQALYIGAKMKDLSPMMNRNNPGANAERAWMGDCTQFRFTADRNLPFPTQATSLGDGDNGLAAGQPLTLTLWYYTDDQVPALTIQKSLAYKPLRPEWLPSGLVPHDLYQAKYVKDADGKGYVFEYRIPWTTLGVPDRHPIAGDVVSATVQFLWGDAAGLNNGASSYDVMSQPGFPFQSTNVWGKMIFSKTGNIPRSWVDIAQKAPTPTPLSFTYQLPKSGNVSVALYDGAGHIVRHIVADAPRQAGAVTEQWDGLDSAGKVLPAGTYTWKGLYHAPITTKYVMSLGNSGQPGWKTADGTGGWGGDYGPPTTAAVAGDTMVLGWTSHEAGWGIIGTDFTGKKKWGVRSKNAPFLAADGTRYFAPGEEGAKYVHVYSAKDGQPMVFGNGLGTLTPPAGGDETSNLPTGLACAAGKLYVSFAGRDLIGVYNADSGDLETSIAVPKPGRLAVTASGDLIAVSDITVVRVSGTKVSLFAKGHVDSPAGVAIDAAGQVYIANWGALQNVSVFSPKGKYLRSIGRTGGRPVVGEFDASGMLSPAGIALDPQGHLWVPEGTLPLKRISVWNTSDGSLWKEFYGGCSYSPFGWVDAKNPREAFFDNAIWNIDLDKGTWYPKAIFYAPLGPNSIQPGGGGIPFRVFTGKNGHQYAVSTVHAFGTVVWIRQGDLFRPLYFLFRNRPNPILMKIPPFPIMNDITQYPAGKDYLWTDTNGDEVAETDEITALPTASPIQMEWMDENLNLYGQGQIYRPTSVDANGIPHYDFTAPQPVTSVKWGSTWTDAAGSQVYTWSDGDAFTKWSPDMKPIWSYNGLVNWHSAINEGITRPGYLTGETCALGIAGRYTGLVSYFDTVDLVRDDGLYVAKVFEPSARGNNGPNIFYVEFLEGQMFRPEGSDHTYIVGGDQDVRFSEVEGLGSVQDLAGGSYEQTPDLVDQTKRAWADYAASAGGSVPLVISRGGLPGLITSDPVGKTVDDKRAFNVTASYDDQNLYFHYNVTSPAPLVNGITDPQIIYKGGNLLDIQIAADPDADPKRTTPAPGDIRLLISQQNGKPWAALFQPKLKGAMGTPIKLTSPTGFETFDAISATDQVKLQDYHASPTGFSVTAVVPLSLVGMAPLAPGQEIRMDTGYIFGDVGGLNSAVRSYWHNNSFTANVVNDIPNESRLEPAQWGTARVE